MARFQGHFRRIRALISNVRLLSNQAAPILNRFEGSTLFKPGILGTENSYGSSWQPNHMLCSQKPSFPLPTLSAWPRQSWHIKDSRAQDRSPVINPLAWRVEIIGDSHEKEHIQDSHVRKNAVYTSSVLKKRKKKMNRHKYKKRRKLDKYKRRNLENIKERKRRVKERAASG